MVLSYNGVNVTEMTQPQTMKCLNELFEGIMANVALHEEKFGESFGLLGDLKNFSLKSRTETKFGRRKKKNVVKIEEINDIDLTTSNDLKETEKILPVLGTSLSLGGIRIRDKQSKYCKCYHDLDVIFLVKILSGETDRNAMWMINGLYVVELEVGHYRTYAIGSDLDDTVHVAYSKMYRGLCSPEYLKYVGTSNYKICGIYTENVREYYEYVINVNRMDMSEIVRKDLSKEIVEPGNIVFNDFINKFPYEELEQFEEAKFTLYNKEIFPNPLVYGEIPHPMCNLINTDRNLRKYKDDWVEKWLNGVINAILYSMDGERLVNSGQFITDNLYRSIVLLCRNYLKSYIQDMDICIILFNMLVRCSKEFRIEVTEFLFCHVTEFFCITRYDIEFTVGGDRGLIYMNTISIPTTMIRTESVRSYRYLYVGDEIGVKYTDGFLTHRDKFQVQRRQSFVPD